MSLEFNLFIDVDTGGPAPLRINLFDRVIPGCFYPMWQQAGCYPALYESDGQLAGSIVASLQAALADMTLHYDNYRLLNPKGTKLTYEDALEALTELLEICTAHPKATIRVWY